LEDALLGSADVVGDLPERDVVFLNIEDEILSVGITVARLPHAARVYQILSTRCQNPVRWVNIMGRWVWPKKATRILESLSARCLKTI